jgi:hypothetical protein
MKSEPVMRHIDLKKEFKTLYTARAGKPAFVEVPPLAYLMVDGRGDPGGVSFQEAVGTLYGVAYTLKFSFKKGRGIDFPVMPLEGLWGCDDMAQFSMERRDEWKWTVMILLPDVVTVADVVETVAGLKKKSRFDRFPAVRLEQLEEKRCAQLLHVGPYADEGPAVAQLHRFIRDHGGEFRGLHHEIYLGDPRRSAPEKLKTIIRQPVGGGA